MFGSRPAGRQRRKDRARWRWRDTCDIGSGCNDGCDCPSFSLILLAAATIAGNQPGVSPLGRRIGLAAITGYRRWLSPRTRPRCRFTPTCSAYGATAIDRYGMALGGRLTAARLRRCRPHVASGTPDPVPPMEPGWAGRSLPFGAGAQGG